LNSLFQEEEEHQNFPGVRESVVHVDPSIGTITETSSAGALRPSEREFFVD
jgi:hypothetical protein